MSATPGHSETNRDVSAENPPSGLFRKDLLGYVLAILLVGVASGMSLIMAHLQFRDDAVPLLLFAIAVSSWCGGRGPALLAVVVSILVFNYFFVEPIYTFRIYASDSVYFAIFVAFASLTSWFATVRRRAEAAKRERADLLDLTHDTVLVASMDGVIRYWNRGAEQQYGWTAEQAVGKVVHELLKTVFPAPVEEIKAELVRTGRWEGELRHTTKDGTQLIVASRWALQKEKHGTPVAILESNNDITERKRSEESLRESEARFRTFIDHAADAFFVQDEQQQGRVLDVNRQACESLGYSREELIGMWPRDFDPNVGAGLLNGIRDRVATGEVVTFETCHRRKDGTTFPVEIRIRPLWLGDRTFHLSLARDISERKRTEKNLSLLNRHLRALSDCNQALLHATDEQSLLQEICRIVCDDTGYRPVWVGYVEHNEAKSVRPVAWAGTDQAYLENARISWSEDTEHGRGPSGTTIRTGKTCYLQDFATEPCVAPWRELLLQGGFHSAITLPLKDEHGNVFGILSIHSERLNAFTPEEIRLLEELGGDLAFGIVTLRSQAARKKAEELVRRHELELRQVLDMSPQLVAVFGPNRERLYANRPTLDYFGVTLEQWQSISDPCYFYHPDDRELIARQAYAGDVTHEFEARFRRHDGTYRWFLFRDDVLRDEQGRPTQWYLAATDIEGRKRNEEERRQSAERFRAIADYTYDWENWFGVDGKLLWVNPAVQRITGYSVDECMAMADFPAPIVAAADRETIAREIEGAREGSSRNDFEFRVRHKDGHLTWIAASWQPIYDSQGAKLGYRSSIRDIAKRKQAEDALRQSEAYLAEAQRLSHTGSWAFDVASSKYLYFSEECFRIFEMDAKEGLPTRETVSRLIHPEDWPRVDEDFERSIRELADTSSEFRIVLPSGALKHVRVIRHPVINDAGDFVKLVGTVIDVTERKWAEQTLRRTTTYLADAHRLTHTGAWATDKSMQPLYWSEEVFRLFGFDPQHGLPNADEMLQRVHPDDRDKAKRTFDSAIHRKVDDEVEFRTVLPGGIIKHLHLLGRPIVSDTGDVIEVVGTAVDITERKRTEETLRENEVRFRTFVDHAADALFILDLEQGTIVDVNQSACDTLGYTRQELIGAAPDFFHQDIYRAEMESVAQRAVLGETVFDTHWHRRKDGSTFPVEVSTSSFSHGGRRFLLKLARDISDRLRAEEAIRRSQKQLREVIDTIPAHVWSASPDGSVDFINRRILEFSGMSLEQAVGHSWWNAIHADDRDHYLEVQRAAIASGQAFEIEARLRRADGEYRWMLFRSVPLHDETGTVISRYGVSTDIDDRKRAEQALRRSEAYLAETQRLTHTGTFVCDETTKPLYWSKELYRIFGFDPQHGLPTPDQPPQRIHPEDVDKFWGAFRRAIHDKVDADVEYRIVLPDRTVKHVYGIGHPVVDANAELVEIVGTTIDITERKLAEKALRRAEGYLAEAQRLTHTGAWATDAAFEPLYWSEELFCLYGFDPQQGIPTHEEAVERVHPEDRDKYEKAFRKVLHQKVDSDVEFRTVLPDGNVRYLYGLGHPILNSSGDVIEIVGTTVDITERKRAEEERTRLRQLETDLAHINRVSMMGELTASIAHEVNQPLAGIVGNASAGLRWLAADLPNLDETRESLRRIVRDGKRAAEVIARTRALTKKAVAQTEKLDLNETLRQVLALVNDEAKKKSVIIETQFADDLSPVLGDRVQMQQVVLNLVMNAIEAMSSVSDRARRLVVTTGNNDQDHVQVTVEDSGVGLDPSAMSKIFYPFYTTKPGGMGMGLSISSSIIQAHAGRLWATSKDSPGTAFSFTLPKYKEEGLHAETAGA